MRSLIWSYVLVASSLAPVASAANSAALLPDVRPLPGIPAEGVARVSQLSADGSRALVLVVGEPGPYSLLLDTRTGTRIWDSRGDPAGAAAFGGALMSDDGRFLVYGVPTPGNPATRDIRRRDLEMKVESLWFTGIGSLVLEAIDGMATTVVIRDNAEFAPFLVITPTRVVRFGDPCPEISSLDSVAPGAALSGDGSVIVYGRLGQDLSPTLGPLRSTVVEGLTIDGTATCRKEALAQWYGYPPALISRNARWLAYGPAVSDGVGSLVDRVTDRRSDVLPGAARARAVALAADGRFVLVAGALSSAPFDGLFVRDRHTGVVTTVIDADVVGAPDETTFPSMSADGAVVTFSRVQRDPVAGGKTTVMIARLDADADGMHDAWEATFGLDRSSAADASLDADFDGLTNAQEFAAGTHPLATPVRYFAEGANGRFFATSLALFNPSDAPMTVNVRYLGPDGAMASMPVALPALGPAFVDADEAGLAFSEFGIVVEAAGPVVAERRMTWDRLSQYGSHAGTGVEAPSRTWYFAEGATTAGIQTFFLLQNPGAAPAAVMLRYLLGNGTNTERQHVVPPQSRLTVWVNREGGPLDEAEFAMTIHADMPVVAERAMYRGAPGELLAAGNVTSGVTAPAPLWGFVEGATGSFFDTYLLLANPGGGTVDVGVQYILPASPGNNFYGAAPSIVTRFYQLAAQSRRTIRVADEDPLLANTALSMTVGASASIVAERTTWWPGPTSETWRESHTDATVASAGLRWAVADIQVDAGPGGWDTFLLITSPPNFGPLVTVAARCEDGTSLSRTYLLDPYRMTLWLRHDFPELVGKRCGAVIESVPRKLTLSPLVPPVQPPIQVEKAMYRGGFTAGSASAATRLQDPP